MGRRSHHSESSFSSSSNSSPNSSKLYLQKSLLQVFPPTAFDNDKSQFNYKESYGDRDNNSLEIKQCRRTSGFISRIWPWNISNKHRKQHQRNNHMSAMAASELSRVPLPLDQIGKRNAGGQKKREELETEVALLQNMLSHEEKIRELLQQAYNSKPGYNLAVPTYTPPKLKELLTELLMVEDEIVRLEGQIEHLQKDVMIEQEATKLESKAKHLQNNQSYSINNNNSNNNKMLQAAGTNDGPQRIGYETKALHFIRKAIHGDHSLTDFTINGKLGDRATGSSSPYAQFSKESGVQERQIKGSGMLKPTSSPLRDFRHPTPKPKERNQELFRADHPKKTISGLTQAEESPGPKWQANKLSENIMKSLMLIYVRLIRTSRQMELEKSGPISRSMYSSLSFRTDSGVSLSTSLLLQKQQDPYGVFDREGAVLRDIGPYKNLVVFSSSSLDSKYVFHSSSVPLFQRLRGLLNSLQKVDLRSLTDQQKLAFWINIYNACIMNGFLEFGLPSTPAKLLTLLNKATLNVGGKIINAQAIERCILRKPTLSINNEIEKHSKEAIICEVYGLESMNANIIFALCCGTRSSPAVRIYTAEGIISELEKSKLEYLQASILVTSSKKIGLPELLIQNMRDFAEDIDSLVEWVCNQLPTSGSLRKSIVECFRSQNSINSGRSSSSINVENLSYNFEFQYLLQV
ncbi:hypothetical protein Cgig2_003071 [Carnegiea gigantea]|uniref:DUF547 domain-containing protein n=1 Tax=Carnegiea gigantea TaxID=171969 RepID=A0A9Q1JHR0_9CARY|nr:hypothetical protein Cgig2_003071 [Carnegiea gigantea]